MSATPAWPPKSAPRLFVTGTLEAGQQRLLDGEQAHYLSQVMRRKPGDVVILCDNATGEWVAEVEQADRRKVLLSVRNRQREREAAPDIWLCAALLKKPHFDMVLEKATELGVAGIIPVLTQRCVADKLNAGRAEAIITEAAEQCARTALPELEPVTPLSQLLARWDPDRQLYFADEEGGMPLLQALDSRRATPAALLIGPEGGFTRQEREAVRAMNNAVAVSLGRQVLRAETAAIAGLALLMAGVAAS